MTTWRIVYLNGSVTYRFVPSLVTLPAVPPASVLTTPVAITIRRMRTPSLTYRLVPSETMPWGALTCVTAPASTRVLAMDPTSAAAGGAVTTPIGTTARAANTATMD